MELRNSFTVPAPVEMAWQALLDIEWIAPCMPGATLREYDGETVTGDVRVRLGTVTVDFRGTAVFLEKDERAHRMVLSARGKETHGPGKAFAVVTCTLAGFRGGTEVTVVTDLTVIGRPARFGRATMVDVADRLVGRFADCLAGRLADDTGVGIPAGATGYTPYTSYDRYAGPSVTGDGVYEPEPIDLLRTAGVPVARRAAEVLGAVALAVLTVLAVRRARGRLRLCGGHHRGGSRAFRRGGCRRLAGPPPCRWPARRRRTPHTAARGTARRCRPAETTR
ncbi:SRPBCC family protein [Streptomyces sp. NPDC004838]